MGSPRLFAALALFALLTSCAAPIAQPVPTQPPITRETAVNTPTQPPTPTISPEPPTPPEPTIPPDATTPPKPDTAPEPIAPIAPIPTMTPEPSLPPDPLLVPEPTILPEPDIFAELFAAQTSGVQVAGNGVVTRLLSDDEEGDKHQRFIAQLPSGQTLLIAHNIDVAPRVEPLAVGDTVEFYGEYYYNAQGGGVHWTHRDESGRHADGYIAANGQTFQ